MKKLILEQHFFLFQLLTGFLGNFIFKFFLIEDNFSYFQLYVIK